MLFAVSLLPRAVLARARYSVPAGWSFADSLGRFLYRSAAMMMTAPPLTRYVRLRREAGIEFQSIRGKASERHGRSLRLWLRAGPGVPTLHGDSQSRSARNSWRWRSASATSRRRAPGST